MTEETVTQVEEVSTEVIEPTEQPIETEIAADELEALRTQAEELKALQTRLAEEKLRDGVIAQAKKAGIRGMEDIYDYLDKSMLTEDKLPEMLAAINDKLKSQPRSIGVSMNVNGRENERSVVSILAEAAEKARKSGLQDDLVAYSKLKRKYRK